MTQDHPYTLLVFGWPILLTYKPMVVYNMGTIVQSK